MFFFLCIPLFSAVARPSSASSARKPASPKKEEEKDGSKRRVAKPAPAPAASRTARAPAAAAASASSSKPTPTSSSKAAPKPKGSAEASKAASQAKGPAAAKRMASTAKEASSSKNSETKAAESQSSGTAAAKLAATEAPSRVVEQEEGSGKPAASVEPQSSQISTSTEAAGSLSTTGEASPKLQRATDQQKLTSSFTDQSLSSVQTAQRQQLRSEETATIGSTRPSEEKAAPQQRSTDSEASAPIPADTPSSLASLGSTPQEESWSGAQRRPQLQASPESESASAASTSSDDMKPRSEDYDAGGSQDDDCSQGRGEGAWRCGTMRCPDFLGRSSSDTSTPEELKTCEGPTAPGGGALRVEVRLRGREPDTTSEEEVAAARRRGGGTGVPGRPRSWLAGCGDDTPTQEEEAPPIDLGEMKSVPDHQLFSSEEEEDEEEEEESEEETSEVEVLRGREAGVGAAQAEPSPQFQGIVNLAFEDAAEQENQFQMAPSSAAAATTGFRRSVLLSVDECEELGSEDGGTGDVFEVEAPTNNRPNPLSQDAEAKGVVFLTEVQEPALGESGKDGQDPPPQERPCHLDLRHTEQYCGNRAPDNSTQRAELRLDLPEPQQQQHTSSSPSQASHSPTGNV